MNYQMKAEVYGNPDYGQDPAKPPYGVIPTVFESDTIKDLKEMVRDWQYENDIGGGNWGVPAVYKDGQLLGYMSYNGRIWDKQVWDQQAKEVA